MIHPLLCNVTGDEASALAEEDRNRRIDIIYIVLQNNPLRHKSIL